MYTNFKGAICWVEAHHLLWQIRMADTDLIFIGLYDLLERASNISENAIIGSQIVQVKKLVQDGQRLLLEGEELEPMLEMLENGEDGSLPSTFLLEDALDLIHSFIQCLMQLLPVIERFARHTAKAKPVHYGQDVHVFEVSEPALSYVRNIRDRFSAADEKLATRLGEANWQRYQRIRAVIEKPEVVVSGQAKSLFRPATDFYDSALGTSVPAQSSYASTVASHSSFASMFSQIESGTLKVPSTPKEVILEIPFDCEICHQELTDIRSRIDWKYDRS